MAIKLGQKGRSVVTGFEGIATALTTWLNGCRRVTLTPSVAVKDGVQSAPEAATFDVEEVEVVDQSPIALPYGKPDPTGGDRPTPTRAADPTPR